jgi:hypothetical protein
VPCEASSVTVNVNELLPPEPLVKTTPCAISNLKSVGLPPPISVPLNVIVVAIIPPLVATVALLIAF